MRLINGKRSRCLAVWHPWTGLLWIRVLPSRAPFGCSYCQPGCNKRVLLSSPSRPVPSGPPEISTSFITRLWLISAQLKRE